jgi:hypothetical protein
MLIKHAIFRSGQPVVLFLDEGKLRKPFQPEKCFPVFGPDYPLQSICRRNPLAVCLGYTVEPGASSDETRAKLVDALTKAFPHLNWSYGDRQNGDMGVLLGANSRFIEMLEGE